MSAQESKANGEPQLIDVELDPPEPPEGEPKKLFRVEVERRVFDHFYVYADTKAQAEDAASELRYECLREAMDIEDEHYLSDAKFMTNDTSVWMDAGDNGGGFWGSMSDLPRQFHEPAKAQAS